MPIDLTSLLKAVKQLEESVTLYHSPLVQNTPKLSLHIRAAAIQAFEFTYELACKTIQRYLMFAQIASDQARSMSYPHLIRTACEYGLLSSDLLTWKHYRDLRNLTSHTYNQDKAEQVFLKIPVFLEEVKYLAAQIKKSSINDDNSD